MAIIDGVPAIEVTLWIGGRPAFEYADPDHNHDAEEHGTKVSSKYIECRNGETFTIHVRVNKTYDHQQPVPHTLNLAVYIDGQWIRGELCRESHLKDGPFRTDIKERIARAPGGTTVKQAFKFAGVLAIDDNCNWRVENEREKVRDLGVIELRVFRVEELGGSEFNHSSDTTSLSEIAEKSLKGRAISHGTQFDDDEQSPPGANMVSRYRNVKSLSADSGPLAIYRFAYRSREGLCKEAIITDEQVQALERAEGTRCEGSARDESPLPVATPRAAAARVNPADRHFQAMRQEAYEQLRDLGVEPPRFIGHRERARARAQQALQGQQPHGSEVRGTKREPPRKEDDLPGLA
ncbi:hypothetical protein PG984_005925 [Apiospora sp. TS-2023a]